MQMSGVGETSDDGMVRLMIDLMICERVSYGGIADRVI